MITSLDNSKVKVVRRLQANRRYRAREGAFVVEGTRWLDDAVRQQITPRNLFYTETWQSQATHNQILQQVTGPVQAVSDEVMASMSDTETPAGVLAVLDIMARPLPPAPSLLLILDRLRDPGNLGTMLRTAGAAGVDGVLLSPGCVDPYNPKVVRASMGAQLRLAIHACSWAEIKDAVAGLQVMLADAAGAVPYYDANWRQPAALLVGSEAEGAGAEARSVVTGSVHIPMFTATESLNAAMAAAIILFEAARQRRS